MEYYSTEKIEQVVRSMHPTRINEGDFDPLNVVEMRDLLIWASGEIIRHRHRADSMRLTLQEINMASERLR